jgi:hypothetical protein
LLYTGKNQFGILRCDDSNALAGPKSGNIAANMLLAKLLAAKALAAYVG